MDFQPMIDSIRVQFNESLDRLRYEDKIEKYSRFINEEIEIKIDSIINELYRLKEDFKTETQRILRLSKIVENPFSSINFKFTESSLDIKKSLIGSIEYPEYLNFSVIKSIQVVNHGLRDSLQFFQLENSILILNTLSSELKSFNIDGEPIEGLLPKTLYQHACGLCVDKEEQTLYIQNDSQFIKFNYKYKNLSKFTNNSVKSANYLFHDQKNDCLIASMTNENKLVYFDHNIVERVTEIELPKCLKLTKDSLFVIGNKCIYKVERHSLTIQERIKIYNNQQPIGLNIDSNGYIYTLASKQDHTLFLILDHQGRLIHRLKLECKQIAHDFFILNNKKLVVLFDDVFYIINFE